MWRRMLRAARGRILRVVLFVTSNSATFQHFQESVTGKQRQRWGKGRDRRRQREMERGRESNKKAKRKLGNRERQCLRHKEA